MKSDKYGERRGAAFGLAGVVKGFGISSLKKFGIVTVLREGLADRFVFYCCYSNLFLIMLMGEASVLTLDEMWICLHKNLAVLTNYFRIKNIVKEKNISCQLM